jgi:predicted GIY-YIG superfamily endonuclease
VNTLCSNETYIYCLIHNEEVKYVGKSDNPTKRLKEHLRKSKYKKTYKDNWLSKLTNLASGGSGGNFGDEINKKISEKLKGRIINDIWRDKIRKGSIGRKHSEETKERYRQERLGSKNPMYNVTRKKEWDKNKRKKIIQLDLNDNFLNQWDSIQDAVIVTNTNRTSINYVLQNKRNTAGGYKWKYYDIY